MHTGEAPADTCMLADAKTVADTHPGGRAGQNPRGATRPEAPTHTHCTAFSHTAAPSTAHETEQRKRRRMGEHTRCKRCKTLHRLTVYDASMYMCMRNECGVYMFMRHDARTYSCCSLRVSYLPFTPMYYIVV